MDSTCAARRDPSHVRMCDVRFPWRRSGGVWRVDTPRLRSLPSVFRVLSPFPAEDLPSCPSPSQEGAFWSRTPAAALALAAGVRHLGADPLGGVPPGIQLYTVGADMQKDPAGTLHALRQIGYVNVEAAGFGNLSPADFRKIIDDAGLKCPSAHLQFSSADPVFSLTRPTPWASSTWSARCSPRSRSASPCWMPFARSHLPALHVYGSANGAHYPEGYAAGPAPRWFLW